MQSAPLRYPQFNALSAQVRLFRGKVIPLTDRSGTGRVRSYRGAGPEGRFCGRPCCDAAQAAGKRVIRYKCGAVFSAECDLLRVSTVAHPGCFRNSGEATGDSYHAMALQPYHGRRAKGRSVYLPVVVCRGRDCGTRLQSLQRVNFEPMHTDVALIQMPGRPVAGIPNLPAIDPALRGSCIEPAAVASTLNRSSTGESC